MELYYSAQSSFQNEKIVNTSKKLLKARYWTFLLEQYFTRNLKYFVNASSYLSLTQSKKIRILHHL